MCIINVNGIAAVSPAHHKLLIVESPSGKVQDVHPGSLGNGISRIGCHVTHQHTPLLTQFYIYVVYAGSGLADELELRCGVKEGFVHYNLVKARYICVPDPFPGLFCR